MAEGKWYFHQLFVNGSRRTRARTPNEGYLRAAGPLEPLANREEARRDRETKIGFRFQGEEIRPWQNLEDVNVIVYHAWTASWHHIAAVDAQERTVRFTAPSGWPMGYWEREQRYVVENCREALDSPGEWYLDRKTGVLTYWPPAGEDPNQVEVTAPVLRALVKFAGDGEAGQWVEHIRLEGLSFQHADWDLARDKSADGQAATFLGAAVSASGTRQCALERCEIAHVGEHALWLQRACQENRLVQCHLHDMGAGGVYVGEGARATVPTTSTRGNLVHNNFIHDGGHVFAAGIGVWVGQSANNTISHNEVCDLYYSGMSLGWTWGYGPSDAHGNLVEYNHIHHIGQGVLSDMGGIYCLGISPGTVLRGNVIHDILSFSYGGWGLYTDEGSSQILMENNVVYLTKSGGFHQHYGRENTLRNNVFALASEGEIIRSRQEEHLSFTFERNLVYQDAGPLLGGNWGNGNYRMDSNLYWRAGGEAEFGDLLFDEWQKSGQDQHSLVADPGFRDVAARDFRLKPNSPAQKIGFVPIDTSKVGLQGNPEWVNLPKAIRRPPTVFPAPKVAQPIRDDFENTPEGAPATNATTSGQEKGASILVTDETAATGKRCLKFTDAPGLGHDWQPHLAYRPDFSRGKAQVSFDLRVEKGAIAWIECRDSGSPYRVGPSLKVDAAGQLSANEKPVMPLAQGKWLHFEMAFALGRDTAGTYDLVVTPQGGEAQRFEKLPFGSDQFRAFRWFGIVSLATDTAVFYVDNVEVRRE